MNPEGVPAHPKAEIYELAALLEVVVNGLHPVYGSTGRRDRGVGGCMATRQCNLIDPEGAEVDLVQHVEDTIRHYFREAESDGVDMRAIRDRITGARVVGLR
jgi:hypothetical protein